MTPVPTRARSVRFIETYAGFEDESDLLLDLYHQGHKESEGGIRVDIPGWPFPDPSPVYVNMEAGLVMYWDDGPIARRMPWQTSQYYALQAKQLRPATFDRLHNNYWTSSVGSLMPIEWWDACYDEQIAHAPLNQHIPCVIGVDASVSNDCTVCTLVTRHPNDNRGVAIRAGRMWTPTPGNPMNYSAPSGLKETLIDWCKRYNVVEITYDAYQLHNLMTDLRLEGVAWCRPFAQGGDRNKADKQFHDLIRDRHLAHYGDPDMREHIKNAGAKQAKDEDTKFRIVKKTEKNKIDYCIANSMASAECLRLNLD
jgi:phage terminase large subunit-like protein